MSVPLCDGERMGRSMSVGVIGFHTGLLEPLLIAASLSSPIMISPLAAQDTVRVVVRGTVVDAETGAGVEGAMVFLPAGQSAEAERDGAFLAVDVVSGVLVLQVEAFGYHRLRTVVDVTSESPLRLELVPSPQPLEGIVAEVTKPEAELAAAMKQMAILTGRRVAEVSREQFAEWRPADPVQTIRYSAGIAFSGCDLCIAYRGHTVPLKLILDDHRVAPDVLSSLSASDIQYAVVIPRCLVIQVYTVPYFRAIARRTWSLKPFICP